MVVLNDDHNTFDHVARTLAAVIPAVTVQQGYTIADRIHNSGLAIVWSGPLEVAELYWEQLAVPGDDGPARRGLADSATDAAALRRMSRPRWTSVAPSRERGAGDRCADEIAASGVVVA